MNLSRFDELEQKFGLLISRINTLKNEKLGLQREIYSLKANLEQARITSSGGEDIRTKYNALAEERDRLIMEREFIRNKVRSAMERIDDITAQKED